jgi:hypothetical protein
MTYSITKKQVFNELKRIMGEDNNNLKRNVASILLDELDGKTGDEIKAWFENFNSYGCVNGMVGARIYYDDTHKFFDNFLEEILEYVNEELEQTGELKFNKGMSINKNSLAWFGFKRACYEIQREIYEI